MTGFPDTLRHWRQARRLSQLDLALEAAVSARHISFLETGRARPSREMVTRLGDALAMPLSARNGMLVAAGFAPRYPARDWDDAAMAPVRAAIDHVLRNHQPYPALAIDRLWRVVDLNPAAARLFGALGVGAGDSLIDLLLSATLPQVVENWPEVAHHAARRLRTESAAMGGVEVLDRAATTLSEVPAPDGTVHAPVIPTILNAGGMRLSLFATLAQFGTPEDLLLEDLKIELYFPADDATREAFEAMA
ncbi:helix-turn-helix domain-containing protein [Rhodobacterales bacterium HKCCE3408]|nr:helix-turn-helix domain-containing protein [Rhodobacterales bacterium HKCCE3408]